MEVDASEACEGTRGGHMMETSTMQPPRGQGDGSITGPSTLPSESSLFRSWSSSFLDDSTICLRLPEHLVSIICTRPKIGIHMLQSLHVGLPLTLQKGTLHLFVVAWPAHVTTRFLEASNVALLAWCARW